jgi:chaperonin GroEL
MEQNMSKHILHEKPARDALIRGVDFLADTVKITEGPRGRNVILGQRALGQSPKCTRDGVTVSNYADPSDPTEQLGADLVREAAQKTDNAVGDGTTASIVLAQAMIHEGFRLIDAGANPMAMERGIHKATDAVITRLRKMAVEITPEKVFQVATVSAHGDLEIGHLVADAIQKAGKDGVVTAEPSSTSETYVETVAGLELDKSNLISTAFITHPEEMKAELPDCRILLWEGVIGTGKSLVPILNQVHKESIPLIIIAGGYEQEALAILINNKLKLALPLIAVRMEAYGERRREVMRDIAALTGGTAYTEDMGLKIESVDIKKLGQARKVITTMSKTQILSGKGNPEELAGRIRYLQGLIETVSPVEKASLRKRLAALLGGIVVIKVGGVTVTEMEEKKDRVVDAMSAAKAAVESGIVAGGGTALLQASSVLGAMHLPGAEQVGLFLVHFSCEAVAKQIAENAGIPGEGLIAQLRATPDMGYNALTGFFENLVDSGIIDPVKVVIEALKNAAAVSCSILTMGATVAEIKTEKING